MVSAWSPKPLRSGSIPERPAHVVLASRTANARRKPKRSWVRVPETTPFYAACARERCPIEERSRRCTALFDGCRGEIPRCGTIFTASSSPGGDVGFICRTRRVRFPRSLPSRAVNESTRLFDGSECPCREAPVRKHGAALRGWWASGCSEVVSRCVRDAETAGSIPVTPTTT